MQNPSLIASTIFTPNKNPRPNMHGDPLIWRSSKPLEHLSLTSRHLVLMSFDSMYQLFFAWRPWVSKVHVNLID